MRIAIFTNFNEFNPGYSLTGIVIDQAEMLAKYGHDVFILVNEQFNDRFNDDCGLTEVLNKYSKISIHKKTTFMHLIDYQTKNNLSDDHKLQIEYTSTVFTKFLQEYKIDSVFTHDFIFTGWNLPYALAIQKTQRAINGPLRWFHWVHSIPSGSKDWWRINDYPGFNWIVFPTKMELNRVAESFQANYSQVLLIPHIKDIRNWYSFSEKTKRFIEKYPNLLQSEIVQVYPCSSDRLHAKQLHILIRIFGFMKKAQSKVFLLAVNQWATGRQRKEDLKKYIELAEYSGLEYGKDFAFTSKYEENGVCPYELGISKIMLRELQLLSSLFVFPTTEESFGLVGPEASLSGALVVINKSLPLLTEVMGLNAPQYDFGSFLNKIIELEDDNYITAVAYSILNRLNNCEAVKTKIYCKTRYNMDNIYYKYYAQYINY